MTSTKTQPTLHINWVACQGGGHCIELLEGQLRADEWGYPYSPQGSDVIIPEDQLVAAKEAVAMCPKKALKLL